MQDYKGKKCPTCGSRKWHGYKGWWKCGNCGKEIRPTPQKAKCGVVTTANGISPQTTTSSPLDYLLSSKDISIVNSPLYQAINDHHSNAWKFKIIRDNLDLNLKKQNGFDGPISWIYFEGITAMKTANWLILYKNGRNKVPLKNLEQTEVHILQGLTNTALKIAEKYNFEIEPIPQVSGENHPEVKTPFLSANNFIEKEAKAVYKIPSPIETLGKNAVKNAINLTEALVMLNENILLEIQNKQLHQKVLEDMRDTLKEMRPKEEDQWLKPLENLLSSAIKIQEAMLNA